MFDLLYTLGDAVLQPVIVPVLAWTVLAVPVWWLVERTDRLHPYGKYRLLQLILAALPLGILATSLAELLPESTTISPVTAPAVTVLSPIQSVEITAATAPTWGWMHLVGLLAAAAAGLALVRLGQLALDGVAALRVKFEVDESPNTQLDTALGELVQSLGIRRPVQAAVKPEAAVPMTLGGARPTILLPPELTKKPDALRTTLVHECVHIRRWDDLAYLIERFVGAIFFVHPLVAWLCEDIQQARERACDAAVLDDGYASASAYARLLAAFANGSDPNRLGALSLSESPSSLTDRIDAMRAPLSSLLSSGLELTTTLLALGTVLTLGVVGCSDFTVEQKDNVEASPAERVAKSQTVLIGRIVDEETGEPIPRVNVIKAYEDDRSTDGTIGRGIAATGDNGKFSTRKLSPGSHRVLVSSVGYEDMAKNVTLESGEEERVTFQLSRKTKSLPNVTVSPQGSTSEPR